jgi:transcriptional antiterminator NusG
MTQATPQFKADYVEGEAVKITDGPFTDFLGTVNTIDEARGKVEILINIFGRETPVELDFLQVQKV